MTEYSHLYHDMSRRSVLSKERNTATPSPRTTSPPVSPMHIGFPGKSTTFVSQHRLPPATVEDQMSYFPTATSTEVDGELADSNRVPSSQGSTFALQKSADQNITRRLSHNFWETSKSMMEGYVKLNNRVSTGSSVYSQYPPVKNSIDETNMGKSTPQRGYRRLTLVGHSSPNPRFGSKVEASGSDDTQDNTRSGHSRRSSAPAAAGPNVSRRWSATVNFSRPHASISQPYNPTAPAHNLDQSLQVTKMRTPSTTGPESSISFKEPWTPTRHSIYGNAQKGQSLALPMATRQTSVFADEKIAPQPGIFFRSRRLKDLDMDLSWLKKSRDPRRKWLTLVPLIGIFLGLCLAMAYIYLGVHNVPKHKYCVVYEDDFSSNSLDTEVWTKEVSVGGFGNGQFEETTADDENVFVKDNTLFIMPTLQDQNLLTTNNTLNLTALGTCTMTSWNDCVASTNTTNGTIINPVKSGRINTKKGANIKYGRVEVVAKMPEGDWLWPAIWMLPKDSLYGDWPRSGEIDIAELRGNNYTYPTGGNNLMSSTLHWGPDSNDDGWWQTFRSINALHSTFSQGFHTFGLEWSEHYLYTYLDGRLLQVLYDRFNTPFWERGNFPLSMPNGTAIINPWAKTDNPATPFDQDFYLILNVAVGGTNGWFQNGKSGKPWVDESPTAKKDFWEAKDQWYPTWQKSEASSALQVKSVKIWQQQGYNGCFENAISIPNK